MYFRHNTSNGQAGPMFGTFEIFFQLQTKVATKRFSRWVAPRGHAPGSEAPGPGRPLVRAAIGV
jgi:hypothetical protein